MTSLSFRVANCFFLIPTVGMEEMVGVERYLVSLYYQTQVANVSFPRTANMEGQDMTVQAQHDIVMGR
jgi:hypothetical protein